MTNLDNGTMMLAFVAITGLAVLLQAIVLLAILSAARKAARSIESLKEEAETLRSSMMPVIHSTGELFTKFSDLYERIAPKIESSATDLAQLAHGLRVQTALVQSSTQEILERVNNQSRRMDSMMTGVLDAVDRAGSFVTEIVSKPVRQISGILASIKAVVESLSRSEAAGRPANSSAVRAPADKDMFT